MPVKKRDKSKQNLGLLVIDFRQKDGSLFPYEIQMLDDHVMGGRSEAHASLDEVNFFYLFLFR